MREISTYTVDEFISKLTEYHGNFAPGLLIGGFMVGIAMDRVKDYELYDAICESPACLPDAIQILTPCTVGNGWLKIVDTGRFAVCLYDKKSGKGVRVYLDASKLDRYPEIKNWFLRLTPKQQQDKDRLINEIKTAGHDIYSEKTVEVSVQFRGKHAHGSISICPSCGEAYPRADGEVCLACGGLQIYK